MQRSKLVNLAAVCACVHVCGGGFLHQPAAVSYFSTYDAAHHLYSRAHASRDLACKNAKFTMKLSATCHATLGGCGELSRTYRDFELKLIYKQTAGVNVHFSAYMYINSPTTYDV